MSNLLISSVAQLAVDATFGVTGNGSMHPDHFPGGAHQRQAHEGPTLGISGWVYRGVRGVTRLQVARIQAHCRDSVVGNPAGSSGQAIATVNRVMGDYF